MSSASIDFILALDPLRRRTDLPTRIAGFPLQGSGAVCISAHAGGISPFMRDSSKVDVFQRLFQAYGALLGAMLNPAKSATRQFGFTGIRWPLDIPVGVKTRVLAV